MMVIGRPLEMVPMPEAVAAFDDDEGVVERDAF